MLQYQSRYDCSQFYKELDSIHAMCHSLSLAAENAVESLNVASECHPKTPPGFEESVRKYVLPDALKVTNKSAKMLRAIEDLLFKVKDAKDEQEAVEKAMEELQEKLTKAMTRKPKRHSPPVTKKPSRRNSK